ncbi:hypothetical protein SAMN05421874_104211 [Nonomuraea maritima]|uniref:Uncharacterized protein n=1 Tax=Nonomuraea maritima TaxID=683260 RepID=A0A1G8Y1Y6_9ACTN|nr:hypothetical protein [Nonomuraea maritima]SDJ96060.1 hypothetical protein SAMN05421874_104211 [Nonomuraea maritima]
MPPTIATALLLATTLMATPVSAAAAHRPYPSNVRDCFDGKCTLALGRATAFPVSPQFGITRLHIAFTADTVKVTGTGEGVRSQAQIRKGASGAVNGIGVRVTDLSQNKAVLVLTPKKDQQ